MDINVNSKIEYLVADTTAFINAVQLNDYAVNVLTVPDVMAEVRNKRQIRRLCVLPFDLQVRAPSNESIKHCVEFSKKTGDYASLSGIDIKVIALTYELEAQNVGTTHLRNEPVISQTIASKQKPVEFQDQTKLAGWYNPNDNENDDNSDTDEDDVESNSEHDQCEEKDEETVDVIKANIEKQLYGSASELNNEQQLDEKTEQQLQALFHKMKCEQDDDIDLLLVPTQQIEEDTNGEDQESQVADESTTVDEDSDDSAWITPSNIKKVKKSLEGKVEVDTTPSVACMSTDYAVQNVLKQMNLQICALNGKVIKHLRTYILRCYACFKTTSIMTKVFCPNCGNKTLKRVAVSLDEHGKQVIHINTRRPLTAKYKNQSLPRFKGGKHSRNPILFEDQPIPRQMPSRIAKTKTNALEEDYVAGFSPFVMRDIDSKSAMLRSKGNLKEWARNNNFEEDRRRKHYNRLYK